MWKPSAQIKGYKIRLPLDVVIVASANPEDYTNRGRIITPLKDRYGAQIRTHYPHKVEHEIEIMLAESHPVPADYNVEVPDYMKQIIAEISRLARKSPDVNQRSGVSVRASIANYESMLANALRRLEQAAERREPVAASPATGHMFIVNPLRGGGVMKLFSTHPPIEERIERLSTIAMGGA